MPPPFVPRRVEDIIYYYYAKLIIAPSAGFGENYGFIIDAYKRLKSGNIRMSDYERELSRFTSNICAFCESKCTKCQPVHVVPRSFSVPPGMQNLVISCESCAKSKNEKDLVDWWCKDLKKPRDILPRLPLGMYLKIAYELHKIKFSLRKSCKNLGDLFTGLN